MGKVNHPEKAYELSNTFSMLLHHNCMLCVGKREVQALSIECEPDNEHLDECNFSLVPCPKKVYY